MDNLNEIKTHLENVISEKMSKVQSETASKSDFASLQKDVNNLKAIDPSSNIVAKGENLTKSEQSVMLKEFGRQLKDLGVFNRDVNYKAAEAMYINKTAGLNPDDSTQGAEFVPSLIDPIVNKLVQSYGVGRQYCRVIPNVQGTLNLKSRATRAAVAFTARADTSVTPTNSTYGSLPLTPAQVSGITTIAEKLVYLSPINVVEEATSDLAESAALLEDTMVFNGDGTSTYGSSTGIKSSSATFSTVTSANFNFDAILNLQTNVNAAILQSDGEAKIFMHPYIFAALQQKRAVMYSGGTEGLYIYDPALGSWKIGGREIVFVNAMDSTIAHGKMPVVFGNLKKAVALGVGRDVSLRVLTETFAQSNEIGVRLTYDVGCVVVQPSAVTAIKITS